MMKLENLGNFRTRKVRRIFVKLWGILEFGKFERFREF